MWYVVPISTELWWALAPLCFSSGVTTGQARSYWCYCSNVDHIGVVSSRPFQVTVFVVLGFLQTEGVFVWSDGSGNVTNNGAYTHWMTGEPNDANNEDCGAMTSQGLWNDLACSTPNVGYICERPASEYTPSGAPVLLRVVFLFLDKPRVYSTYNVGSVH